jgi:hypothetical protein
MTVYEQIETWKQGKDGGWREQIIEGRGQRVNEDSVAVLGYRADVYLERGRVPGHSGVTEESGANEAPNKNTQM